MTLLELARKYFSHALVIIDDIKEPKVIHNNVARALWGLLKVCKTIASDKKRADDPKNIEIMEVTKERLN